MWKPFSLTQVSDLDELMVNALSHAALWRTLYIASLHFSGWDIGDSMDITLMVGTSPQTFQIHTNP
jgi:hypothetical protein